MLSYLNVTQHGALHRLHELNWLTKHEKASPSSSTASTVAPLLSSACTTVARPLRAARWRGLEENRGGCERQLADILLLISVVAKCKTEESIK